MIVNGKLNNTVVSQSIICMSLPVCSICGNPKEIGSSASEGMNVLSRHAEGKQGKSKSIFPLSPCQAEGVAQNKGASSYLKIRIKDVYLPTSRVRTRSGLIHFNPSKTTGMPHFWIVFISFAVKLTTSNRKSRPEVEETT